MRNSNHTSSSDRSQSGVALITALLVVAIVTVIATGMATRQQLDIRRSGNVLEHDQAYMFALGVESWARSILIEDRRDNAIDNLSEIWATVLPPISVEGGNVTGHVEDMQGRFNINNLIKDGKLSPVDVQRFERLLKSLELNSTLSQAVADWIDSDSETISGDGAEDSEYMGHTPPYRAANTVINSVSELRLVKGFTKDAVARLEPFISALPTYTHININTAPPEILMILADDLTKADADAMIEDRGTKGYADIQKFIASPTIKSRNIPVDGLGISSDYFTVDAASNFGKGQVRLLSLIYRTADNKAQTLIRAQGVY